MASRMLSRSLRASNVQRASHSQNFSTSIRRLQETTPVAPVAPVKRPVGAFRGGIFGFLLGSTLAGAGCYTYILNEYRVSNELLTDDIFSLQATVQRVEAYVKVLEDKIEAQSKKG